MKLKSWAEAQYGRSMALAKAINLPPSFVSKMLSGDKAIPAVHCKAIEAFTGGAVTCQEMRPDDWQKYWPELAPHPADDQASQLRDLSAEARRHATQREQDPLPAEVRRHAGE